MLVLNKKRKDGEIMTQPKITDETAHKIRYMYLHHRKPSRSNTEYSAGKAEGIRDVLNFLGIEIDKVNAECDK